jgi:hypothetical protein
MTVHKAKGLEFPVVILADITAKLAQREPDRFVDPESNLCVLKLGGWMPEQLRDHATLENQRDEAEGVRLAYVAATRARDLLVVPAVGDKPFDEGWLRPLIRAIYPPASRCRTQKPAPGCPTFKSKDSVVERPNGDPARPETVCPGLHEFGAKGEGAYSVTWWDPNALQLSADAPSGIRRPELITKEADPKVIADGLRVYKNWRASREAASKAGAEPSMLVQPATVWASVARTVPGRRSPFDLEQTGEGGRSAEPTSGDSRAALPDVEILPVDLPSDRPTGRRFGSLVHSVLSAVPLEANEGTIRGIAEVHGRILGASTEQIAAAPASVAAFLAHPVMARAREAAGRESSSLQRELPVTLRAESGELVDGTIDLAFEEESAIVLVDFKTDADLASLARYQRQLQAYGAAMQKVTGRQVRLASASSTAV